MEFLQNQGFLLVGHFLECFFIDIPSCGGYISRRYTFSMIADEDLTPDSINRKWQHEVL